MVGIAAMWPMLPSSMTTVILSQLVGRTPAFFNGCLLSNTIPEQFCCDLTVDLCPLEGSTAVPNFILYFPVCLYCVLFIGLSINCWYAPVFVTYQVVSILMVKRVEVDLNSVLTVVNWGVHFGKAPPEGALVMESKHVLRCWHYLSLFKEF